MARKPDSDASREAIGQAAIDLIKQRGTERITVDQVAKAAGVAKGLVHYHFKTKRGLFEAVAAEFALERRQRWVAAFGARDPQEAIDKTWAILTEESADGTLRAWGALFGSAGIMPEQAVRDQAASFGRALGEAAQNMVARLGLRPTIPASEVGWLLAAVVQGMGSLLTAGADVEELEGAYAAAWLGVLSLTRSER
ncbi:MAG: TetR/AcrR family transcriptional regulator [Gemmatimonadales bacterium]